MKVNLHMLEGDFRGRVVSSCVRHDFHERGLSHPAAWTPGSPMRDDVLHVLRASALPAFLQAGGDRGRKSALIAGRPTDIEGMGQISYLVIAEDDESAVLSDAFEAFARYADWHERLLSAALSSRPLVEFGRLSEPVFGKPLILYDRFYQTLFYLHSTYGGNVLPERVANSAIPEREMAHVREESAFFDVREPYSSPTFEREFGFGHVCYNVFSGRKRVGILSVIDGSTPVDGRDRALITVLGDLLARVMTSGSDDAVIGLSGRLSAKIKALLAGSAVPKGELDVALADIGWSARGRFCCICLVDLTHTKAGRQLLQIANRICEEVEGIMAVTDDNVITFVCNLERTTSGASSLAQKIKESAHARAPYERLGVSGVFPSFEDLSQYRKLALKAIELEGLAGGERTICRFDDYLGAYFRQTCLEGADARALIPDELRRLLEYDEARGTNLAGFTRSYLANERSIVRTAQEMLIHRNTVLTRLEKVREVSHINLEDQEARLRLILAFMLLDA